MNPKAAHPTTLPTHQEHLGHLGSSLPALPLPLVPTPVAGLLAELPAAPEGRSGWPWTVQTAPCGRRGVGLPRITIVTPAFRHAAYLEETIRSVLLQNYPNLEFIVMDGGSQDGSTEILEKYRPWLSFSHSAPDKGQGHAINLGFALATGELRGWLNSDDLYLPGALQTLAAEALRSPADFFYGDGLELREDTGAISYAIAPKVRGRYRHFGGVVFSHSAFWREAIHEPIWEHMRCNVDGELWQRLLPGRRFHYIPQPLGLYRHQPMAKTINPKHLQAWADDDAEIWAVHGRPPALRSLKRYEYLLTQRFSTWLRAGLATARRRTVLQTCAWPQLPKLPNE